MDLSQTKLSKSEWLSVEIPVADQEKRILSLILDGYWNPDICTNRHLSLLSFMKVEPSEEMDFFLFKTHFAPEIDKLPKQYAALSSAQFDKKIKPPSKADMIRIQNLSSMITTQRNAIFDFVLLDYAVKSTGGDKCPGASASTSSKKSALYGLLRFRKLAIRGVNRFLLAFIDKLLSAADKTSREAVRDVFLNAPKYIERNKALMEYDDDTLYSHQRDLFRIFLDNKRRDVPKCVLYMAPTGTGKTLSPIGLAQDYRIIFVCAARHVGLALAKSAISVGKRVAFAFGCDTSSDVRLHYFAAADYTVNKKSGGIHKVDNSNGSRVEIMICDVASYLVAMYYMKGFHNESDIITYWDEPTISMDSPADNPDTKSLHELIHQIWSKNQISKIVLSCATLPKPDEIGGALQDFRAKFSEMQGELKEPEIHVIDSHDCKKTISLLNKNGRIALPHLLFPDYAELMRNCVEHCEVNKSLLRYFDVAEIIRFAEHVQRYFSSQEDRGDGRDGREELLIERHFKSIESITLHTIKLYYLAILRELPEEHWPAIHQYMVDTLKPRFSDMMNTDIRKIKSECIPNSAATSIFPTQITRQSSVGYSPAPAPVTASTSSASSSSSGSVGGSGILLTTVDAHTLTDGPTIYLAEDVEKIGRFYIQQSKIPESIFATIQQKIDKNGQIQKQMKRIEQEIELKSANSGGSDEKSSKKAEKEPASKEVQRMLEQIAGLREAIQTVHLNSAYIPNTRQHQEIWLSTASKNEYIKNAFVPNVDEEDVREIMSLEMDGQRKLLLILGIGVFSSHHPAKDALPSERQYTEIMKRLAYEQRLFLIIASSDYIYGTNYQFCHGFIGKDLTNMTQQKTIQAIGRIGRNNIQQEYTVRFRDDGVLESLFRTAKENREAEMMNALFSTDDE
jgi:hypothetical protein